MHGLYVMWWVQEKHVPVEVVAAILAAGDLAVTALEVPTGWLADRRGHRASLIVGSILQTAGMLFAWLGRKVEARAGKRGAQFGDEFLPRITFIAEAFARSAVKPRRVPGPVDLMPISA